MIGGDQRHRLALIAHLVDREHRLITVFEPVELVAGDVLVCEYGVHTRIRERLR